MKIILEDRVVNNMKQSMKKCILIPAFVLGTLMAAPFAFAADISVNTFNKDEVISSSKMNENFSKVVIK